jgi:dTDP-4-dehydrorhamnose reductase
MNLFDSIVITGANGMLGHALIDALHTRGLKPIILPRAECDLAKEEDVRKIFEHRPSLLLNCAAHTKVDQCEQEPELANRINGTAVGQMAGLCREHGTKLVHVSTDFVFNGRGTQPYKIDEPVAPLSAYGKSKLLGEVELQKNAPKDWLIVRTAWVYGRHGANFPRTMVTVARAGKPLAVVSDQVGSPTYTVDLAAGILSLLDHNAQGIYHISNSGQTNWCDFARESLKEFGVDHPVSAITSADWEKQKPNAAARPRYSVLDLSRFEETTGGKMRPWKEALAAFHTEVEAAGGF